MSDECNPHPSLSDGDGIPKLGTDHKKSDGGDFWLARIFFWPIACARIFLDCSPLHEFFFYKIFFMHNLLLN